jgi:hypothetical protein
MEPSTGFQDRFHPIDAIVRIGVDQQLVFCAMFPSHEKRRGGNQAEKKPFDRKVESGKPFFLVDHEESAILLASPARSSPIDQYH